MNNLEDLYKKVSIDILDKRKQENFSHGEYSFSAFFSDRDDFFLNVNMWYNNIQIENVCSNRKYFFDVNAYTKLGDRVGTVIFDVDIDTKLTYLELIEVYPAYRHRGIGKKLLDFMEYASICFKSKAVDGVYARNMCDYSQHFYNSSGYKIYNGDSGEKVCKKLDKTKDYSNIKISNVRANKRNIIHYVGDYDIISDKNNLLSDDGVEM